MARLPINQTIETREPVIEVDAGLDPGPHRFQLVVFDAAGNRSAPDVATVEVRRGTVPTPPGGVVVDRVTPVVISGASRTRRRRTDS
jgi:hypothetical protein